MVRGTFANIRLQNQLLDGVTGGYTRDFTQEGGPQSFIYDAAQNYKDAGTPLVAMGGKDMGLSDEEIKDIVDNWAEYLPKFVKVMPVEYRRALMEIERAQAGVSVAAE